jgi:serine/threonine protein kinase
VRYVLFKPHGALNFSCQSNILIDDHNTACLADFGLSKIRMHTTTIQDIRPLQGSLRWMSPEHMEHSIVNKMTDIYSFGMTIYEVWRSIDLLEDYLCCPLTSRS